MKQISRTLRLWLIVTLLCGIASVAGCVRRKVILVPAGEPVMLAEDVKARIYIKVDGKLVKSPNRVTIPAGWWCLPDEEGP